MESPTTKVRNHTKTYGSGKGEVWFYYLCNSTWVTPNVLPFLRQFSHRDNVKKCYFNSPKAYFIILSHHFIIFHLSDVLSFNYIH